MGKRGQGEGSIYPLANGKFRVQVTLPDGRKTKVFDRQKDAITWKNEMLGLINKGLTVSGTNTKFEVFITEWMALQERILRRKSVMQYQGVVDKYLIPTLGKMSMGSIKPAHIDKALSKMSEMGATQWTLVVCHKVLSKAMRYAADSDFVPYNPVSKVRPPKQPEYDIEIMTEDEMSRFMAAASGHRLGAYFYIAVVTGMRLMELSGLTWDDIDWENKVIKVRHQLDRFGKFVPVKTKSSKRSIDITEQDIQVLLQHEARQREELAFYKTENELNLVFTSQFGKVLSSTSASREYKRVLETAGVRHYKFHSLRHYSITYLLMNGTPVLTVCQRAGHSNASITLRIYGHFVKSYQKEAAKTASMMVPMMVNGNL